MQALVEVVVDGGDVGGALVPAGVSGVLGLLEVQTALHAGQLQGTLSASDITTTQATLLVSPSCIGLAVICEQWLTSAVFSPKRARHQAPRKDVVYR